eukprot:gene717-855_t
MSQKELPAGENGTTREDLMDLMKKKKDIEDQMEAYSSYLKAPGNPGMDESLIDEEGFPRADIDLWKVREARNKIICLNNDLKEITDKIKVGLEDMHSASAVSVPTSSSAYPAGRNQEPVKLPFVSVSELAENSPAATAGLQNGDLIVRMGNVVRMDDRASGKSVREQCDDVLKRMAGYVKDHQDSPIEVDVKRNGSKLDQPLILTPKTWSGPGIVGCRFRPLDANA